MKNVIEIKKEAKEQIIKLLNMCDCYNYKEEYIDTWLDVWEEACSPQIEAIAEKSPFYDGKCKIVFPSEFPREINERGINSFCDWLSNYVSRNLSPAKINDLTYEEVNEIYKFYQKINAMDLNNVNINLLPNNMRKIISQLSKLYNTNDYYNHLNVIENTYYTFRNSYEIKIHNDKAYLKKDYEEKGANAAIILSMVLREDYAQKQFLDERLKDNLDYYFGRCKFTVGQKLSRAVKSIASTYKIDKDPEWEREFAKYANSINPLTVTKWTVLSWHPIDYLTFCFGNSWSTCSNIDKRNVRGVKIGSSRSSITNYVNEDYVFRGEHAAAALSYMFDKTSFIYYTVNHKYDGTHYEEQDKESRIVFSLNEEMNTLLQSRLYPQCNDDNSDDSAYRIPREIVQKVISDALDKPNLWKMRKGSSVCRKYGLSTGVHYPDYTDERNDECNISWLGDEPKTIYIGHDAICPNCGKVHTHCSSLNCYNCDPDNY